jgi:hypothetical protein
MRIFEEALNLVLSLSLTRAAMATSQPTSLTRLTLTRRIRNGLFQGIDNRVGKALARKQTLRDCHPNIAAVMHSICIVQREMGHHLQSLDSFQRSRYCQQQLSVFSILNTIGNLHLESGNGDDAMAAFHKAR